MRHIKKFNDHKSNAIKKNYSLNKSKSTFVNEIEPLEIKNYIKIDELNDFTRKMLSEIYNDPSDSSYYTPQQLEKINVEKMIERDEIWGSLYDSPDGRILQLECDSDIYRLQVSWFINIDKKEGIIR